MATWRIFLATLILGVWVGSSVQACPFCMAERGPTMTGDYGQAMAVLLVHVGDAPRLDLNNEFITDVTIDEVIKSHASVKGKKKIMLRGRREKSPAKFVLFCDIYKGKIDVLRAVDVPPGSVFVKYLKGAIAHKDKAIGERLRYCFDYLNCAEFEIAMDAYREYAVADYKDYQTIAKDLPADKIAGWLKDPKTPPYRFGLYSSLLGHCGGPEHAKMLRSMIDDALKKKSSDNLDGLMAGYLMLKPREAWGFVQGILRDGKEDFLVRYACIRTANFLRDQRPDLIAAKDLIAGVALTLEYPDIADHGIDYLRKERCWDRTDQVLNLYGKKLPGKDYDNDYIKRAILRFAMKSPRSRAAELVKEQRRRHPDFVNITEELLKLESR